MQLKRARSGGQMVGKKYARYGVPAAVVALIAGGAAVTSASGAGVPGNLPAATAQDVLAEVLSAKAPELSGTLTWTANLGFSALSTAEQDLGAGSSSSEAGTSGGGPGESGAASGFDPLNLLSGSWEVDVWLDGTRAEHLALITSSDEEEDLVRNGSQAWLWDSSDNTATHILGPATGAGGTQGVGEGGQAAGPTTSSVPPTPGQLAARILSKSSATTDVALGQPLFVAGQPAYQLLVTPKGAPSSTVDHVEVDVAGPGPLQGDVLQVAVYAKGQTSAALSLGYTGNLTIGVPPAGELSFTPPAGATVTTERVPAPGRVFGHKEGTTKAANRMGMAATGWGAIVSGDMGKYAPGLNGGELSELTTVVQVGGQDARLLSTSLLNVLFMPDGNFYAGLVSPAALEAAAAR